VGQGLLEQVVLAAVDGDGVPALDREALLDAAGDGVRRRPVVDHDHGERGQAERRRELHRLVVAALVELGVAHEDHDTRGDTLGAQAERRTHRQRQSVPE
jgi:hypothetical protein